VAEHSYVAKAITSSEAAPRSKAIARRRVVLTLERRQLLVFDWGSARCQGRTDIVAAPHTTSSLGSRCMPLTARPAELFASRLAEDQEAPLLRESIHSGLYRGFHFALGSSRS
jgi:hypothetical protein